MENFFDKFRLKSEKEDLQTVITNIDNGVVFRGTNLWVLIFAIFVASLGLNLNSTAVIIGAMLISPLMGPIMGIGLGIGINDVILLRKALYNYFVATIVALTTSTIFFVASPLNDAHSEILSRTSPNVYDVLIALFGGFAGIIATSSKQKGNVIPGVAIATALMPPLCTAGYGIATLQYKVFMGAFYLYIINTVFIMLATFIIVRVFHFPYRHLQNKKAEKIAQRIVWSVVLLTLLPSIYFAYDMIEQNRFSKKANHFINNEANFPNDYLLSRKIDAKTKKITLVFGGKEISPAQISALKTSLNKYDISGTTLEVKQGFAYLAEENNNEKNEQLVQVTKALEIEEKKARDLQKRMDSIKNLQNLGYQVYKEIKSQYPVVNSAIIQPVQVINDSSQTKSAYVISLSVSGSLAWVEKMKLENWLKIRLNEKNINLRVQP